MTSESRPVTLTSFVGMIGKGVLLSPELAERTGKHPSAKYTVIEVVRGVVSGWEIWVRAANGFEFALKPSEVMVVVGTCDAVTDPEWVYHWLKYYWLQDDPKRLKQMTTWTKPGGKIAQPDSPLWGMHQVEM